jgi:hypothetical protein
MPALEIWGELSASERPTIPVPPPRESGVRLNVSRVPTGAATVDIVVCDLTRDPRSEAYIPVGPAPERSGFFPAQRTPLAKCEVEPNDQNESPPSTSTVLALK